MYVKVMIYTSNDLSETTNLRTPVPSRNTKNGSDDSFLYKTRFPSKFLLNSKINSSISCLVRMTES